MINWDVIGKAATIAKEMGRTELYEQILDLREEILNLREQNIQYQEKLQALETRAKTQANLRFDGAFYMLKRESATDEGPFCQLCWDRDKQMIRLQFQEVGHWRCEACDKSYWQDGSSPARR